jgi:serine/threonine-protein kinase
VVLLTHRLSLLAARFGWSAEVQEAVAAEVGGAAELEDTRGASPTLPPDGGWEPPLPANPLQERYVDLGLLGTGGMGEVRRVHDRRLGRTAALKSLRRELATHGPARARFVAEAEITAQLTHPGVIPVYDIGTLGDGRPFYTMKEVTGRTLAAAVAALHTMSAPGEPELRRVVSLFVRVAETIAYAHDRGITHRDLKPDNVMIGAFGEVLVLDWGLARLGAQAEADEAIQLTVGATR